jgi:hypothetical protein
VSIYQEQAEQLVAEYETRRAKTGELRRKLGEIRETVTGPRGSMKVTVDAQGNVTALEFPTGAYKRMAPKELADGLLETIGKAQEKAMESVGSVMTPEMPGNSNILEMMRGKADAAVKAPTMADIPQVVQEYLGLNRTEQEGRPA